MWDWRSVRYKWYEIEEHLKRVRFKEWINSNPKTVIGLSIASGVLFLLIVITSLLPPGTVAVRVRDKAWFYDLNTHQLFVAGSGDVPPINAPSGALADGQPAGVRAYVFSYVNDPKESERFIGYLEKFTPEGQKMISTIRKSKSNVTRDVMRQLNRNRFVRRPSDTVWFPADSNDGRLLLEQFSRANESGLLPRDCLPK